MVKNRSAGPLTSDQQETFKKILIFGSAVEGVTMGVAAGVAAAKARPGSAEREGPLATMASDNEATEEKLSLVRTLEKGERWIDVQDEMRYLQWTTRQEHYLISYKDNSVRLFSGGEFKTTFEVTPDMRRVLGHTHPIVTGPSVFDRSALRILRQRSSWLLEPGLPLQRFHP